MVIEQVEVARRRALAQSLADPHRSDRLTQVIAIAQSWDDAPGDRRDLPPRGDWARCFAAAATRGFQPRPELRLSD